MGKKQRRKIARLEHEQRQAASVRVQQLKEIGQLEFARDRTLSYARNVEHRYHQELARYKFIDEILQRMSTDNELRDLPLFRYMQGESRGLAPQSFCNTWPPYMQQAFMPQMVWSVPNLENNDPVKDMMAQVLTYYLFRQHYVFRQDYQTDRRPVPVLEYEMNGARRSYILPKDLMKMPEADALQIVMREIAPAVLAMFKEIAERG